MAGSPEIGPVPQPLSRGRSDARLTDVGESAFTATASVPGIMVLENWSAITWSDGVRIPDLCAFDRLTLCTRNSLYEIVVLTPGTCEVLIRGGRFFPAFARAHVSGCSLGGSFLKLHSVHPGFCMEVVPHGGPAVVTTRVRTLAVHVPPLQAVM